METSPPEESQSLQSSLPLAQANKVKDTMSYGPCEITFHPPCIIKDKQSLSPALFTPRKCFKKKGGGAAVCKAP